MNGNTFTPIADPVLRQLDADRGWRSDAPDIWCKPILHDSAWTPASLGGKPGLLCPMTDQQLQALDVILQQIRNRPVEAITRFAFNHPLITDFMGNIYRSIMTGGGVVVIAGPTRERYSEGDLERIAWGFATFWGQAAIQNKKGERLGHVREDPCNPRPRGYQSRSELTFHSDAHEILSLTCVQSAASGGLTRLVSALTVHNEILAARPDLLPALYRGYRYAVAEGHGSPGSITPNSVPVFSCRRGLVSCMFLPKYMRAAAELAGTTLPADLEEALTFFRQTANRNDLVLEFALEPGEMLVCHNFTNLHARTEYEDDAPKCRHLLRVWLRLMHGRPIVPALLERGEIYDQLHREQHS